MGFKIALAMCVVLLTLQQATSLPFRNAKLTPEPSDAKQNQHVEPANVEGDIGDAANDKAEDLDKEKKVGEKEDDNQQAVPIIGGDKSEDDDREDIKDDAGNDLKFHDEPLEKLPVDKLRPVDHMEGVRMEQDGHVNKDFHKEMFLGKHEEFQKDHYEEAESKLKDIVYKVDTDQDGLLTIPELEAWVKEKIEEHFSEAKQENEEIFKHLDPDNNGKVHWKEYYMHFLLAKGYRQDVAAQHLVDYDIIDLDAQAKEDLVRYKFRWTDADEQPSDNELTRDEFMSFRHPEQNKKTLNSMAISIMEIIDTNNDGVLSAEEYSALPPGEVEGEEYRALDKAWRHDRQEEFRTAIDVNHDGKVTIEELKEFLDPRNPVQALAEAKNLMKLMDDDKDGRLSMFEIMQFKDIFISSKVMNFAANVHDEF